MMVTAAAAMAGTLVKAMTDGTVTMSAMTALAMLMVAALLTVTNRRGGVGVVMGGAADGGLIVDVVVVALLVHMTMFNYSAPNPPVGIGAQ